MDCFSREFQIENYDTRDGLKSAQVYDIIQDEDGYIWLATFGGGISKFNGRDFVNFTNEDGLSMNKVLSLFEDSNGNIWVGTYGGGVCVYDGKDFKNYTKKDGLANNKVYEINEDAKGNIWMALQGGNICIYDGREFYSTEKEHSSPEFRKVALKKSTPNKFFIGYNGIMELTWNEKRSKLDTLKTIYSNKNIWAILKDSDGQYWGGTYGKGVLYRNNKGIKTLNEQNKLSDNTIYEILEDHNGNKWFATDNGGVSVYRENKDFFYIKQNNGLAHNRVRTLFEDREGNVWIGTDGGVTCYKGRKISFFNENSGLTDENITSISGAKKGKVWLGTFQNGAAKINPDASNLTENFVTEEFNTENGLIGNRVWSILKDSQNRMWFGTEKGLTMKAGNEVVSYTTENGLPNNTIYDIMEKNKNEYWIATDRGLSHFDGKNFKNFTADKGLNHKRIRTITEDTRGNLWLGTYGGGVVKYNGDSFSDLIDKKEILPKSIIYSMDFDNKGRLWIGTYGNGLIVFDPDSKNDAYTYLNKEQGLSGNSIIQIKKGYEDSVMWVSSLTALHKLNTDLSKEDIIDEKYDHQQGFKGVECVQDAVYRSKDGKLWFGTLKGAYCYWPSQEKESDIPPQIHISNIQLFYKETDWKKYSDSIDDHGLPKNLKLPWNKNHLTFKFDALNYSNPKNIRYKYILQGGDKKWENNTKHHKATFSNL
ncbi:MAG: two-component regulator propeller domain-containing protein, partial [Flavobacteriales bacterium]